MDTPTQPAKPVLSPATFPDAVLRLAVATDEELREWDRNLNAELRQHVAEQRQKQEAA